MFENVGRARRSVVVYGSCLTVVPPAGAARVRLQVKVTTDTTPVQPGAQVVREACPSGWFAVATGYARPDEVTVEASFASSRGGSWSLRSTAASQALADLQLVCARVL